MVLLYQHGHGAFEDFLGGAVRGDRFEQTGLGVEVGEGGGGGLVDRHAGADRVGLVVFSLDEFVAADVADVGLFGWAVDSVVDGFAMYAGTAAGEAGDDFVEGELVVEYGVDGDFVGLQQLLESGGLGDGAGESVEEESGGTGEACDSFFDHVEYGFVGYEFAFLHEAECGGHGG